MLKSYEMSLFQLRLDIFEVSDQGNLSFCQIRLRRHFSEQILVLFADRLGLKFIVSNWMTKTILIIKLFTANGMIG